MKIIKDFDDTKLRGVIADISTEIQSLQQRLGDGVSTIQLDNEAIVSELKEGNEIMRSILSCLDSMATDIEEMRKPWYRRVFCG